MVGIIGVVVGIIGCFCLAKANKIKAKEINNSNINQAETLIVNNGIDTYAVIKLARETTKEELIGITDALTATTLDLEKVKKAIDAMNKIHIGTEPNSEDLREGDLFFKIET